MEKHIVTGRYQGIGEPTILSLPMSKDQCERWRENYLRVGGVYEELEVVPHRDWLIRIF